MATEVFKGIRRNILKSVPCDGGGYTNISDGYEISDIELSVDLAMIARKLGPRAMKNKTGHARYLDGAVIVNVLNRKRSED